MILGTSVTWQRLGLRSRGTLRHFRDQRERFVMESHRREAPSPRTLSNGFGSSESPTGTFGARLWEPTLTERGSGVHSDYPLATHWKHHVQRPPRVTWRVPPSSLRKGDEGAYNKKPRRPSIVLSLRAEARRLLSHQATAKLSTTSTDQLKNSEPDHAPELRPGRMREQQGQPRNHGKN
jgi:hypothetical protein